MTYCDICRKDGTETVATNFDGRQNYCSRHFAKLAVRKGNSDGVAACIRVAEKGIRTSYDFAEFMSLLMADVVTGRMDVESTSAACNAGKQLLKVVEMQMKHGEKLKPLPLLEEKKKE